MIVADAQYYDGRSPSPLRVQIVSSEEGIQILSPEEGIIIWDYAILREQSSDLREDRMIVSPADDPSKFLSFENKDLVALVREKASSSLQKQFQVGEAWLQKLWAVLGAIAVVVLLLIYVVVPWGAKYIAPAIPYTYEHRLGESAERDLLTLIDLFRDGDDTPLLCDSGEDMLPVRQIIADLQRSIYVAGRDDPDLQGRAQEVGNISVKIVNSDIVNAFALPGGRILIFRGLLEEAVDDYDTLSVILAHEMAHVMKRHNMQGLVTNYSARMVLQPVGLLLGVPDLFSLTEAAFVAGYTLEMEKEADAYSVPWVTSAGLDPSQASDFFAYLQSEEEEEGGGSSLGIPDELVEIFQTHPSDESRIAFFKANPNESDSASRYGDYQAWLEQLEASCPSG